MTTSEGPKANEAWTFSSLRHHLTSLAERDGFRDRLRVHGIRGAMANKIDPKASAATRGQALDHMDHDSYLKYQSSLKAVDMMALYHDLDPDYECREMEQSMAHHRDQNVPLRLDAASLAEFEKDEEVILINQRISELTQEIHGRPDKHADLVSERSKLYTRKAKKLRTKRSEFIENWWNVCYDEYIIGNDFLERDTTCLFQIYRKYMPERARLNDNIFKQVPLDSDVGRQCLRDASLYFSREGGILSGHDSRRGKMSNMCQADVKRSLGPTVLQGKGHGLRHQWLWNPFMGITMARVK
ncbi:unnamed protein product [Aspergillus oryzae RIB40]|uniref:DNA, SC138 n=1 Tax=Aspergillus oryzae (strain ATCC 42149 / RIB 40) TaxID=510516 RepID=Q2U1N9_ASPOR|nr:LOW QUALITY PROTEIN: unnamed protein product [Aspergillus oryzae RIB40]BAE64526.1 unnamed protein product [Aspergillus oryzae RIB40]